MKSLHKKLSAMLLAGVVVLGGVVGSGVSSFAASKVAKVNVIQESYQDRQNIKVKNIVKRAGGQVIAVDKDSREIDKLVKKDYKDLYSNKYIRKGGNFKNACEIPVIFNKLRYSKKELVKVQCQNSYYLIKLNQ